MSIDYEQLCSTLEGFLSVTNDIRKNAEATFEEYKTTNPDDLLKKLLQIVCDHTNVRYRQQAAVAIRTVLRGFMLHRPDSVWTKISDETKALLKTELLKYLDTETVKAVRRSICDTVSDLAAELMHQEEWPEINGCLMALVESEVPAKQSAGLKILADLVPQLSDLIRNNSVGVQRIVRMCSKSADADVRYEALCFVASLVQSEPRSVWKHIQSSLPDFVDGLRALIQTGRDDLASDFLVKLVEMADSESSFFKPHLAMFVSHMITIARDADGDDEIRQMAVEVLLCIVEDKPQMCLDVENFIAELIYTLMELMLEIEDDNQWLDDESSTANLLTTRNYDTGESGLDRVAAALGGKEVMPVVFGFVSQYLRKPEWQFKFVGIMAISQTVEYLPVNEIDTSLDEIVTTLLAQLNDCHHRVRFAACQAIGQISLDHHPVFQKNYAMVILPALIGALDDSSVRVQSHAAAALINFTEEVDKTDLFPFCNLLMNKLFERVSEDKSRIIREQCVTAIAVVAGVIEKDFLQYYATIMPVMKKIIDSNTSRDDRTIRGKAIECISIIGLSVDYDIFKADANEAMGALLQVAGGGLESDDPVREYIQEALCRMCRAMKDDFLQYLPHLMPGILRLLSVTPEEVSGDAEEVEDMTMCSLAGGSYAGLKTSVIEDMAGALEMVSVFLEILGAKSAEFLQPTAACLLNLLDFRFSDDVKKAALSAMAEVLQAGREAVEAAGTGDRQMLMTWVELIMQKIFGSLSPVDEEADMPDTELMVAETGGLAKCLRNAGPLVLNDKQIRNICTATFSLMQESSQRRAEIAMRKHDPDFDEEDVEKLAEEERTEQTLRSTLLEVVASIMTHHPDLYIECASFNCKIFIDSHLHAGRSTDDRALGLYVCDDVLEHLKDAGVSMWPSFANTLVECISDEEASVRQAAAYGIIQAAKCSQFPVDLIRQAAARLVAVLEDPRSKDSENQSATDNVVAAIGAVAIHRGSDIQPSPAHLFSIWLNHLPLEFDEEEGRNVHSDLMDLVLSGRVEVIGVDQSNVPKIISICSHIYKTPFSTLKVDEAIRKFIGSLPVEKVTAMGESLDPKLKRTLEKIFLESQTAA